jgi:hypothetical protein
MAHRSTTTAFGNHSDNIQWSTLQVTDHAGEYEAGEEQEEEEEEKGAKRTFCPWPKK